MQETAGHQGKQRPRAAIYGRQSEGSDRSIERQLDDGRDRCAVNEWIPVIFSDKVSARRGRKTRDDWPRLIKAIENGEIDIVWLWESSRGDRRLSTWAAFLELCQDNGVKIWVESHNNDRLYNLAIPRDMKTLADDGADSQYESDKTSLRVSDDARKAARAGRPHGLAPYGYRREYEQGTLTGQYKHPDEAPVVKEIIQSVARGESLRAIRDSLNERGIRTRAGALWSLQTLRRVALNPAYIAKRVHVPGRTGGEIRPDDPRRQVYDADWPKLVDEETFWAANAVLRDPKRNVRPGGTRPGAARHLLSYIALCGKCLTPLSAGKESALDGALSYKCRHGMCVSIPEADLDDLVMEELKDVLAGEPGSWYPAAQADGGQALSEARAEHAKAHAEYDQFVSLARAGKLSVLLAAEMEPGLLAALNQAAERVRELETPPELKALKKLIDKYPEIPAATLLREKTPLPAQRVIIRLLLRIYVDPSPVRGHRVPARQRVRIERATP